MDNVFGSYQETDNLESGGDLVGRFVSIEKELGVLRGARPECLELQYPPYDAGNPEANDITLGPIGTYADVDGVVKNLFL